MEKVLKKYIQKKDLLYINKYKFETMVDDVEELKKLKVSKQFKSLSTDLNKKKEVLKEELQKQQREFDNKMNLLKLEFSKFRDEITQIQEKTVHEAEKVLTEFSKKKLSSKNKKEMRKEELEKHLQSVLEDRNKMSYQQEEMLKIKKKLGKCEEVIAKGKFADSDEVKYLKEELTEQIEGLKKDSYIKERIEEEVAKIFKLKHTNGWGNGGNLSENFRYFCNLLLI
jgi:hypothetical protein